MFGKKDEHICSVECARYVYPFISIVETLQLLGADIITKEEARIMLLIDQVIEQSKENK